MPHVFQHQTKIMGLFDEDKNEEKIPIQRLNDIYNYAEKLSTASSYDRAEKSKGTVSEYGKQKSESAT